MAVRPYTQGWPIQEGTIPYQTYAATSGTVCNIIEPPSASVRGTGPGTCRALYQLKIAESLPPVTGHAALEIARQATGEQLPIVGAPLNLAFVDGNNTQRIISKSLYALDFTAVAPAGNTLSWRWEIEVIFRAPVWGEDEVPASAFLHPLDRFAETRWDFANQSKRVNTAYPVTILEDEDDEGETIETIQVSDTAEIIKNTAGQSKAGYTIQRKGGVYRVQWNTKGPNLAKFLVDQFDNTINSADFTAGPITFAQYSTRFLDAEQWYQGEFTGFPYYRIEVRLFVARSPLDNFEIGPSRGTAANNGGTKVAHVAQNGVIFPGEQDLDDSGNAATLSTDGKTNVATDRYCIYRPVDYRDAPKSNPNNRGLFKGVKFRNG